MNATPGLPYVGQSGNIPRRLAEQVRAGRLKNIHDAKVTEVLGGKLQREIAEFRRIREITGGKPARNFKGIANQRDPIGEKRRRILGLNKYYY